MSTKFLIGMTGSIACYKTCSLISLLRKVGHEVQVVTTDSALEFVGAATLEGLSGRQVANRAFVPGQMMDHIALARWADVLVVAPATAAHIGYFANGLASDLLSTLFLAFERHKPIYLAPAMNTQMLEHPATQQNLKKLESWGVQILSPTNGVLACGEVGAGKMQEPDDIFKAITHKKYKSHILVTYGGTQEPIDGVRSITNLSTGRTGSELISSLSRLGHHITALAGKQAQDAPEANQLTRFGHHQDLYDKLHGLLSNHDYDAIIHLAAVSDYSVSRVIAGSQEQTFSTDSKLGSTHEELTLKLKKNIKIVNQIKSLSKNKKIKVVAFKLTKTLDPSFRAAAAMNLLNSPDVDYVVHNDLNEIIADKNIHPFTIYKHNAPALRVGDINELAIVIDTVLENQNFKNHEVKNDIMS